MRICIISATAREGRWSHKIAEALEVKLSKIDGVDVEIADIKVYNFPLLEYTFPNHPNPTDGMKACQKQFERADAFIVVSPEYNGGYPGALKNHMDYYLKEYKGKPFGIVAVSGGGLGGITVFKQLQQYCLHINGIVYSMGLLTPKVQELVDSNGELIDDAYNSKMDGFITGFYSFCNKVSAV